MAKSTEVNSYTFEWLIKDYYGQSTETFFVPIKNNNDFKILLRIEKRPSSNDDDDYYAMLSRKLYASYTLTINKEKELDYGTTLFSANEWCSLAPHSTNYGALLSITLVLKIDNSITQYTSEEYTCMDCTTHSNNRPGCIVEDLSNMLTSNCLTDVKLITGDGKKVNAHKCILAARSTVFKAMFNHNTIESKRNEVDMKLFSVSVISELLLYMYTNKCPNIAKVDEELLRVADMYEVNGLKYLCEVSISHRVCKENAMRILIIAEKYSCRFLRRFLDSFVTHNGGISFLRTQKEWILLVAGTIQPQDVEME